MVRAAVVSFLVFASPFGFANSDFEKLDQCLPAALEIGKAYLLKEPGLIGSAPQDLEFDAPGQTFAANGGLVYCISANDYKNKKMFTQDVMLDPYDCHEVGPIDRQHPDSACRELDELNSKTEPKKPANDSF